MSGIGVRRARLGLAAARVAVGAVGLLAPRLLQRACLLEPRDDPSTTTAWRYFSVRAFALGAGYLLADEQQREVLERVGVLVDAADTTFLSAMVASGSLRPLPAAWMGSSTAAASGIGVLALRERVHAGRAP